MPASASSSSTGDRAPSHQDRWVSTHLYYHDSLDDLLRSGVGPLVGELTRRGLIEGFFFSRYWQGGPHVRLRVLPRDRPSARAVERLTEDRIGRYFTLRPSTSIVRSEDYLRAAVRLAEHEFGHQGCAVEALQPNNTLRHVDYRAEEDRLGGPDGVKAFEPHFMDSAEVALELITARPSAERRVGRAMAMMLLAASVVISDPERLARYLRRHYRVWGMRRVGGDRTRFARWEAAWQLSYDRQRARLGDLVRRQLDDAPTAADDHLDALSARWVASVSTLAARLPAPESLLFQCLHKHNNRLGITVTEETYLLFLLQRTLTEIVEGKDPR